MNPLLLAVDCGNFEIFRFLLEIAHFSDSRGKVKSLPAALRVRCDKDETCLLKASRLKQLEMVYSMLHLGDDVITQDLLAESDGQGRNLLHFAVINQQRDLAQILVRLDADKLELRLKGDNKKKMPA